MSAFLDFVNAYAIWFYVAGTVWILFGIKLLAESRRISRTSLFSLEQEQAREEAMRAALVMLAGGLFIGVVMGINFIITPIRPSTDAISTQSTPSPYTPPVVLPSITTVPEMTAAPAGDANLPGTEAPRSAGLTRQTPTPAKLQTPSP